MHHNQIVLQQNVEHSCKYNCVLEDYRFWKSNHEKEKEMDNISIAALFFQDQPRMHTWKNKMKLDIDKI